MLLMNFALLAAVTDAPAKAVLDELCMLRELEVLVLALTPEPLVVFVVAVVAPVPELDVDGSL